MNGAFKPGRSLVLLALTTAFCVGQTVAAPPTTPLRISSSSDFYVRAGEVRLEGVVTGVSLEKSWMHVQVTAYTPPGSRRTVFGKPALGTVLYDGATLIVMRQNADRGLGLDELGAGSRVLIVCPQPDERWGPFTARLIAVESLVPGPGALPDILPPPVLPSKAAAPSGHKSKRKSHSS